MTLKGIVEPWQPSMILDNSYLKKAPYFANNQTYLVNGFTSGLFQDVWQILENQLNFTSLLYKPKHINWGHVEKQPNGTYSITTGNGESK